MIVRQLHLGAMDNFGYLVGDEATGRAAVIDPSFDGEALAEEARALGLSIELVLATHGHRDHVADIPRLACRRTRALAWSTSSALSGTRSRQMATDRAARGPRGPQSPALQKGTSVDQVGPLELVSVPSFLLGSCPWRSVPAPSSNFQ